MMKSRRQTMKDQRRHLSTPIHLLQFIFMDLWIGMDLGTTKETESFLCSLVSTCLNHMHFSNLSFRSFLTFGHPKHCTGEPTKYQTMQSTHIHLKSVRPSDLKTCSCRRYQACQSHKGPALPCPIGPCSAFGSSGTSGTSGTSGAFGAFGGFGASGTSTCNSGTHNCRQQ